MCGRYVLVNGEAAADRFGFHDWHETRIRPRYNIAPSQYVLGVIRSDAGRAPALLRWGFQPGWLPEGRLPPPINAKAETLVEKPLWKGALRHGRCLIVADGFYEWQTVPGRRTRQPIHIRFKDGRLFAFAGLCTRDADGILTCAIVTTAPNEVLAPIHHRMPAILKPDDEGVWLDPDVTAPAALLGCLRPHPAAEMEAYPVGPLVGNARADGPELLAPR